MVHAMSKQKKSNSEYEVTDYPKTTAVRHNRSRAARVHISYPAHLYPLQKLEPRGLISQECRGITNHLKEGATRFSLGA